MAPVDFLGPMGTGEAVDFLGPGYFMMQMDVGERVDVRRPVGVRRPMNIQEPIDFWASMNVLGSVDIEPTREITSKLEALRDILANEIKPLKREL
ncbi:hypothetical protein NG798_26445 [Ancylothrix sp. C2]|uniref:hypothetical protein n=1 Tax=Ancylothrix sp. D3o TaxID=2953691 RepID=UPI0021BA8EB7|nr:hypothetical protein [Ancylothrix sp. D3o]MCT7953343.1 hypothetical protein [Ancylothrix sp. D3o]